jgi:hypothetical protein
MVHNNRDTEIKKEKGEARCRDRNYFYVCGMVIKRLVTNVVAT